jgi:putative transposase
MKKSQSLYHGRRFPAGVISCAVRWCLRDIEELLFERGVTVTCETIRSWCDKFGASFAHRVKAARRSQTFLQACAALSPLPRNIVTDQLRSYPAAKAEIPTLASVKHAFVKAAARPNNRAESGHQPTREHEHRMRGFCDPKRTQEFLSCFGPIRQHFAPKRHLLRALLYRKQLAARFVAWREFAELAQNLPTGF